MDSKNTHCRGCGILFPYDIGDIYEDGLCVVSPPDETGSCFGDWRDWLDTKHPDEQEYVNSLDLKSPERSAWVDKWLEERETRNGNG